MTMIEKTGEVDWAAVGHEYAEAALSGGWPQVRSPQYALAGGFTAMAREIERLRAALATQPATSPMKMAVDRDWLTAKIAADPDAECDAGVMHPEAPQPATSQGGKA